MIYDRLGKAALRFTVVYVRRRYRRQLRIGVVLAVGAIGVGIYFANRNVPEG